RAISYRKMNCRPGSDKIHVVSGRSDDIPQSRLRATSAPFLFNLCFHAHNLPISRPKLSRWGSAVAYVSNVIFAGTTCVTIFCIGKRQEPYTAVGRAALLVTPRRVFRGLLAGWEAI